MNSASTRTDWNRLASARDNEIDTSDIPELNENFFARAELRMPPKRAVTLRLDTDVLAWLKKQGKGYQTRINWLLRRYYEHARQHQTAGE